MSAEYTNEDLLNAVSPDEKAAIKGWISLYAEQGPTVSIDEILTPWAEQKKDLFHVFDEQLILEKDIEIKLDNYCQLEGELYNKLLGIRDRLRTYFIKPIQEKIAEIKARCNYSFQNYYCDEQYIKLDATSQRLSELISYWHLFNNIYDGSDFFYNGVKITKGMKTIKAIHKLCQAQNIPEEEYEQIRLQHSQILNNKTFTGRLCLSIHPLDFMTMSDNESGWSSCMSWRNYGDYRQGTIEMMNSPCVVIAYLKSNKDMYLQSAQTVWNNKKWRQLYVVTPELIASIRQYPFSSYSLNAAALNWIKELCENCQFGEYFDKWVEYTPDTNNEVPIPYDACLFDEYCSLDFHTNLMYNDFYYTHTVYLSKSVKPGETIVIDYSGPNECLCCGTTNGDYEENLLTCWVCGGSTYQYCCCCGGAYHEDELIYFDDEPYCEDCYAIHFGYCEISQESYPLDDLRTITNENNTFILTVWTGYFNKITKMFPGGSYNKYNCDYTIPSEYNINCAQDILKLDF